MIESGESFGKYRLLDKIAAGGMAEIYRAATEGPGGFRKVLAIKRLHSQFGEDAEFAQMLVDEARIAVRLSHPNIAQIFDLGRMHDQYFIAMEYIEGIDVHQIHRNLKRAGKPFPVPVAIYIVIEALGGLHYAHTRTSPDDRPLEIVHRDVSPQNIMVSNEGEVKLVDFGIAKAELRAQRQTQAGIIKGKFFYMAPEQAHGHHVDARTDIFSAGMILYELLSGENPYADVDDHELLRAVRRAQIPPLRRVRRDIDHDLEHIIMTALQRDPSFRFESAQQMQRALIDYLDQRRQTVRRQDVADFVRQFRHQYPGVGVADAGSDILQRVEYRADEASVIFDPDEDADPDHHGEGRLQGGDAGSFDEEAPTAIWLPDDDQDTDPLAQGPDDEWRPGDDWGPPAPEPTHTADFAPRYGAHGGDHRHKPATAVRPITQRWRELLPEHIRTIHVVYAGIGLAILLLSVVLVVVLAADDTPTAIAEDGRPADPAAAPATVSAVIASTPSAAQVEVDGEPAGTTPTSVEGLVAGQVYTVRIARPGYESVERELTAGTDEALEVELAPAGGVLKITSYPPNATITVDGDDQGRAPVAVTNLAQNEPHEVVAVFDDGRTLERTVAWEEGEERIKEVELSARQLEAAAPSVPKAARDEPRTRRRPARQRTRRTERPRPPPRPASSSGGGIDIWGDSGGSSKKAEARSGAASKESGGSPGIDIWGSGGDDQAATGYVSVAIRGGWGQVYVNGRKVAAETPLVKHPLPAGSHKVKVYYSKLKRYSETRTVTISAGKNKRVIFAP